MHEREVSKLQMNRKQGGQVQDVCVRTCRSEFSHDSGSTSTISVHGHSMLLYSRDNFKLY